MPNHQAANLHDAEASSRSRPQSHGVASDATRHPLIRIQSTIGNAAVTRLLAQRQDVPEEEELQLLRDDRLAQREAAGAEEEDDEVAQAAHDREGPGGVVGLEGGQLRADLGAQIDVARGGGSALGEGTRTTMERALGSDLGDVRVHQDPASDSLARGMTARAFTSGSDIFLRRDVNPGDTRVLAHELTHVIQQASGRVTSGSGPGYTVGAADDAHEREADSVARAVESRIPSATEEETSTE